METTVARRSESFSVDDCIDRLGVRVLSPAESEGAAKATSTEMAEFRTAPTFKAIARDLARVAATTSDNEEGARRRWLDRLVMTTDTDGHPTDMPLILRNVTFAGTRQFVNRVPDIGVGTSSPVRGLGTIELQPLFILDMDYIALSDGAYVPTRAYAGVIFRPTKTGGAYKFVPVDLADPALIARWNGIVEQGKQNGTYHAEWPIITPIDCKIGKHSQRFFSYAPTYLQTRSFDKRVRGRNRTIEIDKIGTYFLKSVIMAENSQPVPVEALKRNAQRISKEKRPTEEFVFLVVERENSLEVRLRGRLGEEFAQESLVTMEEAGDNMNPFDVLNTTIEQFEARKAVRFIDGCLKMTLDDDNPLYRSLVGLGLAFKGMTNVVVNNQIRSLANEAYNKAVTLWGSALASVWNDLSRMELPGIDACLAGQTLETLMKRLNVDDVAAAWISERIASHTYLVGSPFHRELRAQVLRASAKRSHYTDPPKPADPDTKPEESKQTDVDESKAAEVTSENPAPEKKRARPRKARESSKPKA